MDKYNTTSNHNGCLRQHPAKIPTKKCLLTPKQKYQLIKEYLIQYYQYPNDTQQVISQRIIDTYIQQYQPVPHISTLQKWANIVMQHTQAYRQYQEQPQATIDAIAQEVFCNITDEQITYFTIELINVAAQGHPLFRQTYNPSFWQSTFNYPIIRWHVLTPDDMSQQRKKRRVNPPQATVISSSRIDPV